MKNLIFILSFLLVSNLACAQSHPAKTTLLKVKTTQGEFEIKLFTDIAPKACENIIGHAKIGFYDGLIFHRVIKGFMIQGGDPDGTGAGGKSIWGEDFEDEFNSSITFDRSGLLAMANRGPHTNGSQFFITTVPTPHLNMKHTIFGEVTKGYETIQKIEDVPTDPRSNRPLEDQKIIRIEVIEE